MGALVVDFKSRYCHNAIRLAGKQPGLPHMAADPRSTERGKRVRNGMLAFDMDLISSFFRSFTAHTEDGIVDIIVVIVRSLTSA